MKLIESILVVLNSKSDYQSALVKAIEIAKSSSASIELFLVAYNRDFVSHLGLNKEKLEEQKNEYIASKQRWIATYVADVNAEGIEVTTDIAWHSDVSTAILSKVSDSNADLVIKSTKKDSLIEKFLFTPSDWLLLEHCEIPLLLTKKKNKLTYNQIMAAVKPPESSEVELIQEDNLATNILKASLTMTALFQADSHVCHCYDPKKVNTWQDQSPIVGFDETIITTEIFDHGDTVRLHEETLFAKLLSNYAFEDETIHLVSGSPVKEIPTLVSNNKIDLLVMGMCDNGKYIGNTIEDLLHVIDCDLLSIKSTGK